MNALQRCDVTQAAMVIMALDRRGRMRNELPDTVLRATLVFSRISPHDGVRLLSEGVGTTPTAVVL